jgi:hypothetical protein
MGSGFMTLPDFKFEVDLGVIKWFDRPDLNLVVLAFLGFKKPDLPSLACKLAASEFKYIVMQIC